MPDLEPLLDPRFLARLEQLELVSKKIFVGRMKGERLSKRKGQSVEFAAAPGAEELVATPRLSRQDRGGRGKQFDAGAADVQPQSGRQGRGRGRQRFHGQGWIRRGAPLPRRPADGRLRGPSALAGGD